jgi:hypothetical protein
MNRFYALCLASLALGAVHIGCASSREPAHSLTLSSENAELKLTLGEELARKLLEGALRTELRCNATLDPEVAAMLKSLEQGGGGARFTMVSDGVNVVARRRGSKLRLDVSGQEDWKLTAVLPWKAAECLLGRPTTGADLGPIKVKLSGSQGGRFELALK